MAGRIRSSDIEEVKQRVDLAELIGDYVALKNAGVDSMKGLCPFHDERSPSFHVRRNLGYYHCFGCGESGDAIAFLQRHDHLTFTEAVERLAARVNYVLTYEEGTQRRSDGPNRSRLFAANAAAAEYFVAELASTEAEPARRFLDERGFDAAARDMFGVGYAPRGWDNLTKHLSAQGFTRAELSQAGLASEGQRGVYDRFRGRIIWPIKDTSSQVVGFGARKLFDDDNGPKYLNSPESPIYQKSRVLYGLDLAKRDIARNQRTIVVEGYTDVMACHLAGETSAVATCGTAFGKDHVAVLRRMMGDSSSAEVIFTFDPDEAGQKAALRAFSEERLFSAQTYVAIPPEGFDPADLRLHRGDEALRAIFAAKVPLFEFALQQAISRFDLNSVAGRVSAMRAAAPIIADMKDPGLQPAYTRELARMLGAELREVQHAVRLAGQSPQTTRRASDQQGPTGYAGHSAELDPPPAPRAVLAALPQTPAVRLERDALMAMLQQPQSIGIELLAQAVTAEVTEPTLRGVRDAIAAALDSHAATDWLERVVAEAPDAYRSLIHELAVAPMPQRNEQQLGTYARAVVISLLDRDLLSLKGELMARMQRVAAVNTPESRQIQEQLAALESARRALRTE